MKKLLFAALTGILLSIAWPTYGFPLFLFFAFVPLLLTEYHMRHKPKSKRRFFGLAYLAFFIWNIITTWWIYNSSGFGMWFAVCVNSLLMTLVFFIYHILAKRLTFGLSMLFLVTFWISFEYLHLNWDFSFPWLNLGNGFATFTSWIQWYEYTGTFGGTLWVWLVNILIFKAILLYQEHKDKVILYRAGVKSLLLISIPIIISIIILNTYTQPEKTVAVAILQPNIDPYTEKYNTNDKAISKLLDSLILSKITANTDFIIAPETVFADNTPLKRFPVSIANRTARNIIQQYPKVHFLSGISMYDRFSDPSRVHKQTNYIRPNDFYDDYNSAFFVRPNNSTELYHKTKLVVGVENFPYQNVLKPILGDVMLDLGGTVAKKTTQEDREVFFTKDSIGVAPIICYESIYGEFVTGYTRNKADFFAIITNDAWWGNTEGHRQHLNYARLRAIENRKSIARSANTGISAIIDPTGKILDTLPYESRGVLSGKIALDTQVTFYAMSGNYIARISSFLAVLTLLFAIGKRRKKV
ncbi:apolipoprotein N-acyltransferase [Aquimarina rhabdastrellae]